MGKWGAGSGKSQLNKLRNNLHGRTPHFTHHDPAPSKALCKHIHASLPNWISGRIRYPAGYWLSGILRHYPVIIFFNSYITAHSCSRWSNICWDVYDSTGHTGSEWNITQVKCERSIIHVVNEESYRWSVYNSTDHIGSEWNIIQVGYVQ